VGRRGGGLVRGGEVTGFREACGNGGEEDEGMNSRFKEGLNKKQCGFILQNNTAKPASIRLVLWKHDPGESG